MSLRHQLALGMVGLLAASGGSILITSPAAQAADRPGCATPPLAKPAPAGEVATNRPAVFKDAEARNAASVPGFAAKAKQDRRLWLDRCGTAFYVDETPTPVDRVAAASTMGAATAATAGAAAPLGGVALADTFTLNSKPGSSRTIYLDFKGGTVTGTAWNQSYGASISVEPYSIDSTVSTAFSDAELAEIQKAWQVVAEDYAPFDVNVTTQAPAAAALDRTSSTDLVYGARALITNGGTVYDACACGGVAYVNVFNTSGANHNAYQPAWVFSNGTTKNGKYIGEAASHEVGHNFGLNHDATASAAYYSGSAPWAPIMGSSYSQPVSQWSRGEYPGANNTQDDLSQIATGAAYRTDEDPAGAIVLGNGATAAGIVSRNTDVDSYRFIAAGATALTVDGSAFTDLDVQLRIIDSGGAQVALVNPVTTRVSAVQAAGMNASASFTAPTGGATYTAQIQGAALGTVPNAGAYSVYGSLGTYQIALATQNPGTVTPPAALSITTASALPAGRRSTAYSTLITATGGTPTYTWTRTSGSLPNGTTLTVTNGVAKLAGTPSKNGTFAFTLRVTDAQGVTATRSFTLTINR